MSRPFAADVFFSWSPALEANERVDASAADGLAMLQDVHGSTAASGLQVMTLGLKSPENIGGICRLAGCFNIRRMHHVGAWAWKEGGSKTHAAEAAKGSGQGLFFSMTPREQSGMLATAKGCQALVRHASWSLQQLLAFLDDAGSGWSPDDAALPPRLPLVVMETAAGAVPIHTFRFPRRCVLLVGAESSGVDARVVRRLVKGFDSLIYVPMPGAHKSLNVVEATCCAVYEYSRQWPEPEGVEPPGPLPEAEPPAMLATPAAASLPVPGLS